MSFVMMQFNRSFHKLSKDVPKLATGRYFSSEESPVNNSLGNSFYRTDEHNPLAHGEKHIGKIYSVRHFYDSNSKYILSHLLIYLLCFTDTK